MTGKVISGCIVGFWLVMMGALVKVELWPQSPQMKQVPLEEVMQRVFSNPQPASRLSAYYRNEPIGTGSIAIHPRASLESGIPALGMDRPGAYLIQMSFRPSVTSVMRLAGEAWCDERREVQKFNVKIILGGVTLSLRGDTRTKKIHFLYNDGEKFQEQQFDLSQKGGESLVGALGDASLRPSSLLGGVGLPFAAAGGMGALGQDQASVKTVAYDSRMQIGDLLQKAFLVESKLDNGIWARTWIDESGEILKIETSLGLTLRSESLEHFEEPSHGKSSRPASASAKGSRHDSN